MFFIAVVVFPVLLLVLLLAMERVERPLRREQTAADLAHVLDATGANLSAEEAAAARRTGLELAPARRLRLPRRRAARFPSS